MLKPHHAFATALLALAATGLSTIAQAGPCVPSTGSDLDRNTCIGERALANNTTGYFNTALGRYVLYSNTTGNGNTGSGDYALYDNTIGTSNTATGVAALVNNTTGNGNTATGGFTLVINSTGNFNTASGLSALYNNTTGNGNTASGFNALYSNETGNNNTASGNNSLFKITTGGNNIALGFRAGFNLTTGSNNIVIGNQGTTADVNTLRIGTLGAQTRAFIAGIRGTTITGGQAVVVNASGQLGVISSSRRYKEDIQPMGDASNKLMQLRPVTFHYKQAEEDGSKPMQYGLIAEEVEQAMPELVVYNKDGTPESVAYQLLPSLLLNEYQKQGHTLATTEARLVAAEAELADTKTRLEAMDAEMAALKLSISRLAAASSSVKLVASQP